MIPKTDFDKNGNLTVAARKRHSRARQRIDGILPIVCPVCKQDMHRLTDLPGVNDIMWACPVCHAQLCLPLRSDIPVANSHIWRRYD